jgi:hypothetical protein
LKVRIQLAELAAGARLQLGLQLLELAAGVRLHLLELAAGVRLQLGIQLGIQLHRLGYRRSSAIPSRVAARVQLRHRISRAGQPASRAPQAVSQPVSLCPQLPSSYSIT